ncbi:MAG: hypothetical protein JWQ18_302 [Conexibacter sp.]|nr:hypothetical protein [Conexibacter sp.]
MPRFYRRHSFAVQLLAVLTVMLPVSHYLARHPTRDQVIQRMADSYALGQQPHLSKAEIRALRGSQEAVPADRWVTEDTYRGSRFDRLRAPGEVAAVASYSDGFFTLSDQRHRLGDEHAVEEAQRRRSVAGGSAAEVTVLACCEGNDAPVALVLRAAAPARVPATEWAQVTDLDLDLPQGHLALSNEGSAGEVVDVPPGRYRMRVAGTGAAGESAVRRERFRVELWPRRANAPAAVVRAGSRP